VTSPLPRLVGMVHLLPLPDSPRFDGSIDDVVATAETDAQTLVTAGFPALIVENFGDAPFHAGSVPPVTIAAMTRAVSRVVDIGVPVGVNVLRNDALAALGIAAATAARFIRVNVLTGLMYTDQGPIVGRAAEVQRARRSLAPDVEVWADVMVKHSSPPPGAEIGQNAADTVERGLADAVIVSGSGTGSPLDPEEAALVKNSVPAGTRIVAGSGVDSKNLDRMLGSVDTFIVGSSLKVGGDPNNRPDPLRVRAFVELAAERGLV
jgi:uncharacterized protein